MSPTSIWRKALTVPGMVGARVVLVLAIALLPYAPVSSTASAKSHEGTVLKGAMFVGIAIGNTVAGTLPDGTRFHLYFLNGGVSTYVDEAGEKDFGRWWIRPVDSAVCIRWNQIDDQDRCAVIRMQGSQLSLDGNLPTQSAELLGTIVVGFD